MTTTDPSMLFDHRLKNAVFPAHTLIFAFRNKRFTLKKTMFIFCPCSNTITSIKKNVFCVRGGQKGVNDCWGGTENPPRTIWISGIEPGT